MRDTVHAFLVALESAAGTTQNTFAKLGYDIVSAPTLLEVLVFMLEALDAHSLVSAPAISDLPFPSGDKFSSCGSGGGGCNDSLIQSHCEDERRLVCMCIFHRCNCGTSPALPTDCAPLIAALKKSAYLNGSTVCNFMLLLAFLAASVPPCSQVSSSVSISPACARLKPTLKPLSDWLDAVAHSRLPSGSLQNRHGTYAAPSPPILVNCVVAQVFRVQKQLHALEMAAHSRFIWPLY